MRSIMVSTAVFAAIWAARAEDEESEDEILRRILELPEDSSAAGTSRSEPVNGEGGFYARRYGVHFPEGFRIHRTFKGRRYEAVATQGAWRLEPSGELFHSLSRLSNGIGTGVENVWRNWHYMDADGGEHEISDLRDPSTIHTRG
ncbi:hypothetical protein [Thalassobaculum sp.]|uniref:hypothetical protein n=1 Tax=Thalassobaculum sp. TaxID=2022740 RepID=UPI0032EAB258